MKMHNDPHSWSDLLELLQSWWLEAKNARDFALWRSDSDFCIRS